MTSLLSLFFYNWGVKIKESWGIILAVLLVFLGIELYLMRDAYALMFQEHGVTALFGIVVAVVLYLVALTLFVTFIIAVLQTFADRRKIDG
jgi:hypothetical protein